MSDTLAAFILPGDTIETPLWNEREQRRATAVVTSVIPLRDRLRIGYRYPSGYESYQVLRGHDRIPTPSDALPPSSVGTG